MMSLNDLIASYDQCKSKVVLNASKTFNSCHYDLYINIFQNHLHFLYKDSL